MSQPKLVPIKIRHRFTLDPSMDPVAFCSTEPYMNFRLPPNPKLVREWKDVTCGFCHHLLGLGTKKPIDRHLQVCS